MARKIDINLNKIPQSNNSSWGGHSIVVEFYRNITLLNGNIENFTNDDNSKANQKKIQPKKSKGSLNKSDTKASTHQIINNTGKTFIANSKTIALDSNGKCSLQIPDLIFGASESSKDEPDVNLYQITISAVAPDGSLLFKQDFTTTNNTPIIINNSDLTTIYNVTMPVPAIAQVDLSSIITPPPSILRIKGKAVDLEGQRAIKNQQIILWEIFPKPSNPDDIQTPAKVIQIAFTDNQGNFTCDVPNRAFEYVDATVALAPTQRIPVSLKTDGRIEDFIYLVLSNLPSLSGEENDCSCHEVTPYLPNAEELVSDQYAQDIGGSCTNFTKPNRVLEEFDYYSVVRTTDPKIKAMTNTVENATVDSLLQGIENPYKPVDKKLIPAAGQSVEINQDKSELIRGTVRNTGGNIAISLATMENLTVQFPTSKPLGGRQEISEQNSIDWDATPTTYQTTTIAHGHLLHFKQRFKAAGYSLGDLLYSLPLAPGQKKQIVMYDWDRKDTANRTEELNYEESVEASLSRDRDITDIASGLINESMDGGSKSKTKTSGWSAGASVSAPIGPAPVMLGVSGGYSSQTGTSSSSAWQDSSRSTVMSSMQSLKDKTQQSASSVRNQRTSVIQSFNQNEHYGVTTEVIANHNHCHAITMQYFEVLRHFAIEQDLVSVQECLFIPLQLGFFDKFKILRWKNILRNNLRISPFGYHRHPLYRAFDVLEKYVANPNYKPENPIANRKIKELKADITIGFNFSMPPKKEEISDVTVPNALPGGIPNTIKVTTYNLDTDAWKPYLNLLLGSEYNNTWLTDSFSKYTDTTQTEVFYKVLVPLMTEKYLADLKWKYLDQSDNEVSILSTKRIKKANNRGGVRSIISKGGSVIDGANVVVSVTFYSKDQNILNKTRRDLTGFVFEMFDKGYPLPDNCDAIVRKATISYETTGYQGIIYSASNVDQSLHMQDVRLFTPCNTIELRDPAKEEWDACVLLVTHLNEFIEHYHKVLWFNMDIDKRFMLLDGYNITYEKQNTNNNIIEHKKSLASVLENRLIGIVGNCLVMPVARGYQLDPTFTPQPGQVVDLLDHYKPTTPIPPFRISVPTKGVFAEAVMGACNSCEKIDDTRFWKWEEHPIPDPTAINPITAPTPQYQAQDMKAKDFAQPIVNIQNAPEAPEYRGTAGIEGIIGKEFKDITGLAGTQANLQAALQQNTANLKDAMTNADKAMNLASTHQLAMKDKQIKMAEVVDKMKLDPATKAKVLETLATEMVGNKDLPRNNNAGSAANNMTENLSQLTGVFAALKDNPKAVEGLIKALTGATGDFKDLSKMLGQFALGKINS